MKEDIIQAVNQRITDLKDEIIAEVDVDNKIDAALETVAASLKPSLMFVAPYHATQINFGGYTLTAGANDAVIWVYKAETAGHYSAAFACYWASTENTPRLVTLYVNSGYTNSWSIANGTTMYIPSQAANTPINKVLSIATDPIDFDLAANEILTIVLVGPASGAQVLVADGLIWEDGWK